MLFEVGEVKSALACSLNATEIFWSGWLQFIQDFKLFELFADFTVNIVLNRFLVSNFNLLYYIYYYIYSE